MLQALGFVNAGIDGAVALMVHAKDDEAFAFYRHYGFLPSPLQPLQLFLPMATIRLAITAAAAGITSSRAAGGEG